MEFLPNLYSSYELTPQEEYMGTVLNPLQVAVLRNKLVSIVTSKLMLRPDPSDITLFIQTEAYERGQMDVIQWLLDCSDAVQHKSESEAES